MIVSCDETPDVVALVPTMGRDVARLERCLESLRVQRTDKRLAVVCVVNSPQSGLSVVGDFPEVRFVSSGMNLGWAGGLIFGHGLVEAPLYWFVQDDNEFEPDCLEHLVQRLTADPRLGLVSPVAVDADGRCPARSLGGVLAPDGTMAYWLPGEATAEVTESLAGHDLSYVASRGSLVRSSAWDAVGGPDVNYYPVLWTDVDFCRALAERGIGFAVEPAARLAPNLSASYSRPYAAFLSARNSAYFRKKWFSRDVTAEDSNLEKVPVPEDLVRAIAAASASTLTDLAGAYAAARDDETQAAQRIAQLLELLDEARNREALRMASVSWRLTRLLRWVRRFFSGRH